MDSDQTDLERQLLDAVGQAIIVTDRGGGVLWASDNLADITGHGSDELTLRPITELVPTRARDCVAETLRALVASSVATTPVPLEVGSEPPLIPVEVFLITPPDSAEDELVFGVSRDDHRRALDEGLAMVAAGGPLPEVCEAAARALACPAAGTAATVVWDRQDRRFLGAAHAGGVSALQSTFDLCVDGGDGPEVWDRYRPPTNDPQVFELDVLPPTVADAAHDSGIGSVCAAPVQLDGGAPSGLVLLWLPSGENSLLPDQRARLSRVVPLLQVALERDRDNQRLLDAASHDPLTGLFTRARFSAVLERQARRSAIALVHVDLDGFGEINRRHGESVGDEILVEVANRLEEVMRPTDLIARLGADDFAVVCTEELSREDLDLVTQRVLDSIEDPIMTSIGPVHVTASVGAATTDVPTPPHEIVDAADKALREVREIGIGHAKLVEAAAS